MNSKRSDVQLMDLLIRFLRVNKIDQFEMIELADWLLRECAIGRVDEEKQTLGMLDAHGLRLRNTALAEVHKLLQHIKEMKIETP